MNHLPKPSHPAGPGRPDNHTLASTDFSSNHLNPSRYRPGCPRFRDRQGRATRAAWVATGVIGYLVASVAASFSIRVGLDSEPAGVTTITGHVTKAERLAPNRLASNPRPEVMTGKLARDSVFVRTAPAWERSPFAAGTNCSSWGDPPTVGDEAAPCSSSTEKISNARHLYTCRRSTTVQSEAIAHRAGQRSRLSCARLDLNCALMSATAPCDLLAWPQVFPRVPTPRPSD